MMNDDANLPLPVNSRLNPPLNQTLVFFKKLIGLIFPLLLVPASSRTPFISVVPAIVCCPRVPFSRRRPCSPCLSRFLFLFSLLMIQSSFQVFQVGALCVCLVLCVLAYQEVMGVCEGFSWWLVFPPPTCFDAWLMWSCFQESISWTDEDQLQDISRNRRRAVSRKKSLLGSAQSTVKRQRKWLEPLTPAVSVISTKECSCLSFFLPFFFLLFFFSFSPRIRKMS